MYSEPPDPSSVLNWLSALGPTIAALATVSVAWLAFRSQRRMLDRQLVEAARARAEDRDATIKAAAEERRRVAYDTVMDALGALEAAALIPSTPDEFQPNIAPALRRLYLGISRLPDEEARTRLTECHELARVAHRTEQPGTEFDAVGIVLGAIDHAFTVSDAVLLRRPVPEPLPIFRGYLSWGHTDENPFGSSSVFYDIATRESVNFPTEGIFEFARRWLELDRPRLRKLGEKDL